MINTAVQDLQASAKEAQHDVRETAQKVLHLQLGLVGFTYDTIINTLDNLREGSQDFLARAITRGEYVENNARQELEKYYAQFEERIDMLQTRFMGTVMQAEYAIEENIEMSRNVVESTQANVEAALEEIVPELEAPFTNYDNMTAKEIVARLDAMTNEQLHEVKIYEVANQNRVTIVREVNRTLTNLPIANYDNLTVADIEPMLITLTVEELETVKAYEVSHENRVTLLQEVDRTLENRAETA